MSRANTLDTTIEPARDKDHSAIFRLLEAQQLPHEGLADHLEHAFVVRCGGAVLGCAALEVYADGALLRSLAVADAVKGQGLGTKLIEAAVERARARHLPALYLLTTTADRYFPKFGFEAIRREEVPVSVRQSVEFTSVCPSSAVAMRKWL